MKKASMIALITGIILLAVGFAWPILFGFPIANENAPEFPLTRMAHQAVFVLKLCGGITAVCGLVGLIFNRQMNGRCHHNTSCTALGISAIVSLGVHCVISFLSCYFLTYPNRHPIRHPASVILGVICFAVFVVLIYLYIKLRKKTMSITGIMFDIVLGVLYLPAFYFIWVVADNVISRLF